MLKSEGRNHINFAVNATINFIASYLKKGFLYQFSATTVSDFQWMPFLRNNDLLFLQKLG